jgi:DNA (cytosine-5)-methyltransferase 1
MVHRRMVRWIKVYGNMDHTEAVTHLGLCAGYGGIELGLQRVIPDLRTVALCEIEAFAIANLVAKMEAGLMDPAPIWPDLRTFPWRAFRDRVDILTGGYPCQPFSAAGKRAGKDDPRHLWPWIADGIRLLRPRLCFFENVEGHISLGLSDVIEDLGRLGYRATWGIFSAAEVGAPHQRKRVFILAHRDSERGQLSHWWRVAAEQVSFGDGEARGDVWPSRPGEQQHGWEPPRVVSGRTTMDDSEERNLRSDSQDQREADGESHASDESSDGGRKGELADNEQFGSNGRSDRTCGRIWKSQEAGANAGPGRSESNGLRQAEPPLGGDADGASGGLDHAELCVSSDNRTDELRLLGNGVVPATAEQAFRTLIKELIAP